MAAAELGEVLNSHNSQRLLIFREICMNFG